MGPVGGGGTSLFRSSGAVKVCGLLKAHTHTHKKKSGQPNIKRNAAEKVSSLARDFSANAHNRSSGREDGSFRYLHPRVSVFSKHRNPLMSRGFLLLRQKVYAKHLAYIQADLRRVYIKYMTTAFSVDARLRG